MKSVFDIMLIVFVTLTMFVCMMFFAEEIGVQQQAIHLRNRINEILEINGGYTNEAKTELDSLIDNLSRTTTVEFSKTGKLNYGEKIALIGENGSGKSTLIRMILGEDNDYIGKIKLGASIKIGYIPQNIVFENENQTLLDYFLSENDLTESQARSNLAKYGFSNENVFKRIGKLSGGEKVKILLMKLIKRDVNFLLLDEPTNHIDIDTREILEEALKEYKGTVLFVSHDRFFINTLADRILSINQSKINSYYGNYDDFIKKIKL